jgi:hypothetical protein
VTKLWAGRSSIPGRCNDGIFSLRNRVQTGSEAHLASHPKGVGGGVLSPRMQPVREDHHSPRSSAKNKSEWGGA